MLNKIAMTLISLMVSLPALAEIADGGRLPDLTIADRGELVLEGDEVEFKTWAYPQKPGKVHVVQYMAATRAASEINKPFTDKMKTALPGGGVFLSTTILNMDEAVWGTGTFVMGELKSNKKAFPRAVLVADEEGLGLKQWQLEEESSAVIVTDADGVVKYFKQGAMTEAEVESTLAMIKQEIAAGGKTSQLSGSASGD